MLESLKTDQNIQKVDDLILFAQYELTESEKNCTNQFGHERSLCETVLKTNTEENCFE